MTAPVTDPKPTHDDVVRAEKIVHARLGATYPEPLLVGTKEARRLAVEFERIRAEEREACARLCGTRRLGRDELPRE